eukprot:TRINITY_DN17752_c0_g1_i1.p1 TRINITY_DN17752_c0_g1~~TRINITY_DN17752_c0_g1_i1.p1  ORF type:complete len:270 (+),score=49.09 TRINITY_DN17752_c0_g1_i1:91-810(+)
MTEGQTTLYMTGLPANTTERELYLLFVTVPGFKHAVLKFSTEGRDPMAFATFNNYENAEVARLATDGLAFDFLQPEKRMKVVVSSNPSRIDRDDKFVSSNKGSLKRSLEEELREVHRKLETHEAVFGSKHEPYFPVASRGRGGSRVSNTLTTSKGGKGGKSKNPPGPSVYITDSSRREISEHVLASLVEGLDGLKSRHIKGSSAWLNFETVEDTWPAFEIHGYHTEVIGPLQVEFARSK